MPRLILALPVALLLLAGSARADSAKAHIAAARRAAKAHKWNTALKEWQAAYRISPDSDDLVGMGDAYAAMGDKANARKQYNAYLADPLALDADAVRGKLAGMSKPSGDDLALDLSGPPKAAAPKATASNDLSLDLAPPPSKPPPKKVASADLSLDFSTPKKASPPPAMPPKRVASNDLSLDFPAAPPPKKPAPVANNDLSLDFAPVPTAPAKKPPPGNATLGLDLPVGPPPAKTNPSANPKAVAIAQPPPRPTSPAPPPVAVQQRVQPAPVESVTTVSTRSYEHNNRPYAYAVGGLAVASLAVGGIYYAQSSSALSSADNGRVNQGSSNDNNVSDAKADRKVAAVALVTGLVLAATGAAIFVF